MKKSKRRRAAFPLRVCVCACVCRSMWWRHMHFGYLACIKGNKHTAFSNCLSARLKVIVTSAERFRDFILKFYRIPSTFHPRVHPLHTQFVAAPTRSLWQSPREDLCIPLGVLVHQSIFVCPVTHTQRKDPQFARPLNNYCHKSLTAFWQLPKSCFPPKKMNTSLSSNQLSYF